MVIEAHGSFRKAHCLDCRRHAPVEHVVASGVRQGKVVKCVHDSCGGLVKPDIVFFGEGLPDDFFILQPVSYRPLLRKLTVRSYARPIS